MKFLTTLSIVATLCASVANAQDMEIEVPDGWTATETGIAKGDSELFIGPVLDFGELTPVAYLEKLAQTPFEGMEITSVGDLEDGNFVLQVTREIVQDGNEARSILFVCKAGQNENRLLELLTDDVFAVISGGKAAIGFCGQS